VEHRKNTEAPPSRIGSGRTGRFVSVAPRQQLYPVETGFTSGKCEGSVCDVTMVGDDAPPGNDTATVFQHQLEQLGFTVNYQPAANDIMITKFCAVPANQPQVCPNAGWIKDFNDPQSILQVPFSGESIRAALPSAGRFGWNDLRVARWWRARTA